MFPPNRDLFPLAHTKYSVLHLLCEFAMSNMVGIGPFITIPALLTALGGPQAMLGWVVALVVALADGLVWSELGAALPGSGPQYFIDNQCYK